MPDDARPDERAIEVFINALAGAIDAAHPKQFDYLSRQLWQAHAAGHIPDQDAQSLAERLHSRRGDLGVAQGALFRLASSVTPAKGQNAPRAFLRAPESKSPDRRRSIERRRRLAASGPMPPALACQYTVGELAVLRIVGDEFHTKGTCDRSLNEIAARAGVCRKLAQLTLRMAARDGLMTIERRPRPGRKKFKQHCPDHFAGLADLAATPKPSAKLRSFDGTGGKNIHATDTDLNKRLSKGRTERLRTARND